MKKALYIPLGCAGLAQGAVGALHMLYFVFGVKTLREEDADPFPQRSGEAGKQ